MKYLSLGGLQYFWQKVKSTFYSATNQPPYPVTSVNGQTGDVTVAAGGAVTSVNNKTGAVTITKSDVGLANVDNTADANKSVANADTVDNKHASDFLGATATAANSAKLGGSLPSAFAPAPTVLYNNTSGSNSTITLSQSAANFTHMRIYYNSDNSLYQSVDVYNPSGKVVGLFMMEGDVNNMYYKFAHINISGTSITWDNSMHGFGWLGNGGTNNVLVTAKPLKIVRVEAWN